MRILLAWPGHTHSTYDIASGYEKALKRLGHRVLNFDYHNRLPFYSEALHHFSSINSTFKRRHGDDLVMASESIVLEVIEFVPDVVLIINGMQLHRRAYDLIHRLHIPMVLLLTESPYLDEWQITIADKGNVAGVFTNDLASVEPISDAVGVPVSYLPHSYDIERHRKRPPVNYFASDVFFHGTLWPERQEMFAPLIKLIDEYDIHIGGIIKHEDGTVNANDLLENNDLAQYYANAKVAINQHRTIITGGKDGERHINEGEAYSIGPRAYEIAACGGFQICDDTRPELHTVFNGHVPTYRSADELLELVEYYLGHDDERKAKADAAWEAVQGCSFDDRAREIVIPFLTEVVEKWAHHIQAKTA